LNWVINVSLIFSHAELTGEYDWIRNRIGFNSEKRFNNSWFMNGLEVENKSATPYSSKRTREDSERLKTIFPLSFLPSADLDLTRTKEE
jgi:hypothetical protein